MYPSKIHLFQHKLWGVGVGGGIYFLISLNLLNNSMLIPNVVSIHVHLYLHKALFHFKNRSGFFLYLAQFFGLHGEDFISYVNLCVIHFSEYLANEIHVCLNYDCLQIFVHCVIL